MLSRWDTESAVSFGYFCVCPSLFLLSSILHLLSPSSFFRRIPTSRMRRLPLLLKLSPSPAHSGSRGTHAKTRGETRRKYHMLCNRGQAAGGGHTRGATRTRDNCLKRWKRYQPHSPVEISTRAVAKASILPLGEAPTSPPPWMHREPRKTKMGEHCEKRLDKTAGQNGWTARNGWTAL